MSNPIFNNQNKEGEVSQFTTEDNGAIAWNFSRWDKEFSATDINKSVRIDWGDGSQPETYGSVSALHTYTASTEKIASIEFGKLEEVKSMDISDSTVTGHLDLTGIKKIVQLRAENNSITAITFDVDGTTSGATSDEIYIYGNSNLTNVDLTGFKHIGSFSSGGGNPATMQNFTGVTLPSGLTIGDVFNFRQTGLVGINGDTNNHLDFSSLGDVGARFTVASDSYAGPATGLTLPTTNKVMTQVLIGRGDVSNSNGNFTGVIDFTPLQEAGGHFDTSSSLNITNILYPSNNQKIDRLWSMNNNLTNWDVSPLSGFCQIVTTAGRGPDIRCQGNTNLTAITTTEGVNKFASGSIMHIFRGNSCDFKPELDFSNVTMTNRSSLQNIYEGLQFSSNVNLVSFIFPSGETSAMYFNGCTSLTGINISNLYGSTIRNPNWLSCTNCTSLSSFTQVSTTDTRLNEFCISSTQLIDFDISNYTSLRGLKLDNNSSLTGVTLPTINSSTLSNLSSLCNTTPTGGDEIRITSNSNLLYVNFKPLSAATANSTLSINISNNSWAASDVNHILVDFDNITSIRYTGGTWTGITLDISGTNAAPDGSSGGFDGLTALSNLTGSPINWTITTS